MTIKRVLVSVHDEKGLADFARAIKARGAIIVAEEHNLPTLKSGGVEAVALADELADASGGASIVSREIQEALGGADRHTGGAVATATKVEPFDMVVVNLNPFQRVAAQREIRADDVLGAIEIDRPALLRSAARNFEQVVVVTDPDMYGIVLDELEASDGEINYDMRKLLASTAFDASANYELAIASWFSEVDDFPTYMLKDYIKLRDLPYGENPHQRAAYYVEGSARRHLLSMVEQKQGPELTFNNLYDLNTARAIVSDFTIPACGIVKHSAPSGIALSGDVEGAFRRALACDGKSAFGGVIAVNREVDGPMARAITENFFEVVFAPSYSDDAFAVLGERTDLRVLINNERRKKSPGERDMRRVLGGVLVQDMDVDLEDRDMMTVVTETEPTEQQWGDLLFAWRVVKWVPSNAIVLARDLETVGIGGGNPSRLDSIAAALRKAGEQAKGAMLASDAFFLIGDAPELAIESGIAGIIQPGGAEIDDEVIAMADEAGIPMVFTGRRRFRH